MRKRSSRSLGLLRQCMRKHSVATVKFSFGADVDGQSRSLGVENCNFSQKCVQLGLACLFHEESGLKVEKESVPSRV